MRSIGWRGVLVGVAGLVLAVILAPIAAAASWTVQPTPNPSIPSSAYGAQLASVSCPSAMACVAVGYVLYKDESLTPLAETWNGQQWTLQATPGLAGGGELDSVSCISAMNCIAVGSRSHRSRSVGKGSWRTVAERWNGASWTILRTPNASRNSGLFGVSCGSASSCSAVGFGSDRGGTDPGTTLAERWNGDRWTIQRTPTFHSAFTRDGYFLGVSCISPNACMAVGTQGGAERWDGRQWIRQSASRNFEPHGYTYNLDGVSCASAQMCVAVGSNYSQPSNAALAYAWNGRRWSRQAVPNPSPSSLDGSRFSQLTAVSCASRTACSAVGDFTRATQSFPMGEELALVEQWNGVSWSIQPTPDPGPQSEADLDGVACLSTVLCTAVGQWASAGAPNGTLVERSG